MYKIYKKNLEGYFDAKKTKMVVVRCISKNSFFEFSVAPLLKEFPFVPNNTHIVHIVGLMIV